MSSALYLGLAHAATGLGVGLMVGMTGVGGGAIMTPLLILLFGIHPVTAVGTDLVQMSVMKGVGSFVHSRHQQVDWRIVGYVLAGSVPGAVVTLLALKEMSIDTHAISRLVSGVLGVVLLLTAVSLAFRPALARCASRARPMWDPRRRVLLTIATGVVIGILVTLSSVGAGAIGITALMLFYPELTAARAVGTDIAQAVPLTLVAGGGHILLGTIDWGLLGSLLLGSVPGIAIGSTLAARVPDTAVRGVLATLLLLVGGKLVY